MQESGLKLPQCPSPSIIIYSLLFLLCSGLWTPCDAWETGHWDTQHEWPWAHHPIPGSQAILRENGANGVLCPCPSLGYLEKLWKSKQDNDLWDNLNLINHSWNKRFWLKWEKIKFKWFFNLTTSYLSLDILSEKWGAVLNYCFLPNQYLLD